MAQQPQHGSNVIIIRGGRTGNLSPDSPMWEPLLKAYRHGYPDDTRSDDDLKTYLHGLNVHYEDTISNAVVAYRKQNHDHRPLRAIQEQVIEDNHLTLVDGTKCTGEDMDKGKIVIHPGDKIIMPGPTVSDLYLECPPPPPPMKETKAELPEPPPPTTPAPINVQQDVQARAALPIYPTPGNLGNGQTAGVYDRKYLPALLGASYAAPEIAANFPHGGGTGIQTVVGTTGAIVGHIAANMPVHFEVNTANDKIKVDIIQIRNIDAPTSREQDMQAREGGRQSNIDTAGKSHPLNIVPFYLNPTTFDNSTGIMLFGSMVENGRIVADPNSPFKHDELYNDLGAAGSFAPAETVSDKMARTGERNQWIQGTASTEQDLKGYESYATADYVNRTSLQPQIAMAQAAFQQNPTKDGAQHLIELLNYQRNMYGPSNFDVRADISKPLPDEAKANLNPAEQIIYSRTRVVEAAASQGITGLDVEALPLVTPIRAVNKDVEREARIKDMENWIAGDKGTGKGAAPQIFNTYYKKIVGTDDPHKDIQHNADERRAAAAEMVDATAYMKSYPENGFPLTDQEYHWMKPLKAYPGMGPGVQPFNKVELNTFSDAPVPTDPASASDALKIIAKYPEATKALLETGPIAVAHYDAMALALPADTGEKRIHFDRAQLQKDAAALGYSPEVLDKMLNREEGNNILRLLPQMQDTIKAGAEDANVLAARQKQLVQLADSGKPGAAIEPNALSNHTLYELTTINPQALDTIRDKLKASGATLEEIKTYEQGILYAKDAVPKEMIGRTHTELLDLVAAESARSASLTTTSQTQDASGQVTITTSRLVSPNSAALAQADSLTGDARDIALTRVMFTTDTTRQAALDMVAQQNPGYMAHQALAALQANPDLQQAAINNLNSEGASHQFGILGTIRAFTNSTPQGKLAGIVRKATATDSSPNAQAQALAQFDSFVSDASNAAVVNDFYTATLNASSKTGTTGSTALSQTIVGKLDAEATAGTSTAAPATGTTATVTTDATAAATSTATAPATPADATAPTTYSVVQSALNKGDFYNANKNAQDTLQFELKSQSRPDWKYVPWIPIIHVEPRQKPHPTPPPTTPVPTTPPPTTPPPTTIPTPTGTLPPPPTQHCDTCDVTPPPTTPPPTTACGPFGTCEAPTPTTPPTMPPTTQPPTLPPTTQPPTLPPTTQPPTMPPTTQPPTLPPTTQPPTLPPTTQPPTLPPTTPPPTTIPTPTRTLPPPPTQHCDSAGCVVTSPPTTQPPTLPPTTQPPTLPPTTQPPTLPPTTQPPTLPPTTQPPTLPPTTQPPTLPPKTLPPPPTTCNPFGAGECTTTTTPPVTQPPTLPPTTQPPTLPPTTQPPTLPPKTLPPPPSPGCDSAVCISEIDTSTLPTLKGVGMASDKPTLASLNTDSHGKFAFGDGVAGSSKSSDELALTDSKFSVGNATVAGDKSTPVKNALPKGKDGNQLT